jgi:hypothetical protein
MTDLIPIALRRAVQRRATGNCEYCLIHEQVAAVPHEPDHIIALKHRGQTNLANLAWTCFACNRHKGSDIASIDLETGRVVRLFHPRKDKWKTHFRLEGGLIIPLTAVGRVTEYLLQFNLPERVWLRERLRRQRLYPRWI